MSSPAEKMLRNLREAQNHLDEAIHSVALAQSYARQGGLASSRVLGPLEAYTEPWLRTFRESSHQPGNLAELIKLAEEAVEEEPSI